MALKAGVQVQTPLGKGVVREVWKNGRLVIEVKNRSVVVDQRAVTPLDSGTALGRRKKPEPRALASGANAPRMPGAPAEVDLHGLTVAEALARVEHAVNEALLGDLPELRVIHGRSGGRIRASLHRWLRSIPTIRAYRVDPLNAGVTIISL